jgi:uncharacterized protein YhfF
VHGNKRGTAGSLWAIEHERGQVPVVGGQSIVTRFDGTPVCLVETTAVAIVPFRDVGAEFAASEGEGDLSLGHWRRVHRDYFTRECAAIGRPFTEDLPVTCESFRLVRVR